MYLKTKNETAHSTQGKPLSQSTSFIRGYMSSVVWTYLNGDFSGIQFGYEYIDDSGDMIKSGSEFIPKASVDFLAESVSEFIPLELGKSDEMEYFLILGFKSFMAAALNVLESDIDIVQ